MNRRAFSKRFTMAVTGIIFPVGHQFGFVKPYNGKIPLEPGGTIGIIAPAFRIDEERIRQANVNSRLLGMKPLYSKRILKKKGYLAGEDSERVEDIHDMFSNPEVQLIWCIDGGYGTTRLLHLLDYELIANNPKPIIGFSDATALLLAIYKNTGNPCFHGPNIGYAFTSYQLNYLKTIFKPKYPYTITTYKGYNETEDVIYNSRTLRSGRAKGRLVGGNLSLLVSLAGTPYDLQFDENIVFVEDIGEEPYRIDRMLTHLLMAGYFKNTKGIILGIFHGCQKPKDEEDYQTLREVFEDRLLPLNVPIFYGFSFGHVKNQCTFPIGHPAELDADTGEVTLLNDN